MFRISAKPDANAKLMLKITGIEDAIADHYMMPNANLISADHTPKGYQVNKFYKGGLQASKNDATTHADYIPSDWTYFIHFAFNH